MAVLVILPGSLPAIQKSNDCFFECFKETLIVGAYDRPATPSRPAGGEPYRFLLGGGPGARLLATGDQPADARPGAEGGDGAPRPRWPPDGADRGGTGAGPARRRHPGRPRRRRGGGGRHRRAA